MMCAGNKGQREILHCFRETQRDELMMLTMMMEQTKIDNLVNHNNMEQCERNARNTLNECSGDYEIASHKYEEVNKNIMWTTCRSQQFHLVSNSWQFCLSTHTIRHPFIFIHFVLRFIWLSWANGALFLSLSHQHTNTQTYRLRRCENVILNRKINGRNYAIELNAKMHRPMATSNQKCSLHARWNDNHQMVNLHMKFECHSLQLQSFQANANQSMWIVDLNRDDGILCLVCSRLHITQHIPSSEVNW